VRAYGERGERVTGERKDLGEEMGISGLFKNHVVSSSVGL
jgi:hypothetical protein